MEIGNFQRRWEERGKRRRGATATEEARNDYYGVPVIHRPHWRWLVIVYFFLGGISAASFVIAALAQLAGGTRNRPIVRAGRYLSFAALLPCPALLILDLGRPERFLNMLRVVKLRSPMSLGSWGLSIFGIFSTALAAKQAAEDGLLGQSRAATALAKAPAAPLEVAGAAPAFFVGGYTGVLLGATAVPIWAKSSKLLGPLFLSSAFSTASAALTLILANEREHHDDALHSLESVDHVARAAEFGLAVATVATLGEFGRPVREGQTGQIARNGVLGIGMLSPLVLGLLNRRGNRKVDSLAALLTLIGGFALRYVAITAGRESADDPKATFAFARRH